MSTKSSIAYSDNFHFYNEGFDKDAVYLELRGVAFKAYPQCVTVAIPISIWETIRHFSAAESDLVDKTDNDLREIVTKAVDARICEHKKELEETNGERSFSRYVGSDLYGFADKPRAVQIKSGLKHYFKERGRQREIIAAMKKHKVQFSSVATVEESELYSNLREVLACLEKTVEHQHNHQNDDNAYTQEFESQITSVIKKTKDKLSSLQL